MELSENIERRLLAVLGVALCLLLAFRLAQPVFFSPKPWLDFVQDDFFYYLKVAQNIADGRGSTFNGLVLTNGYHPLWELVWIAISRFCRTGKEILGFQAIFIFISTISCFVFSYALLRRLRVRCLTSFALSLWVAMYSLRLFIQGMEVNLTLPLIFLLIFALTNNKRWLRSFPHALCIGFLGSLVVLSRLDSLLLIFLIALFCASQKSIRSEMSAAGIIGLIVGFTPLCGYFLSNQVLFHSFLPISGVAKQLKTSWWPSANPWGIMHLSSAPYLLVFLPIPIALILFPFVAKRLDPMKRSVYLAVLLFPFLYFSLLSLRSDWPSWGWYLYGLRPAVCISFLVFCLWPRIGKLLQQSVVSYALLLVFLASWVVWKWPVQTPELYATSIDLAKFAETHPGVYAMGDRSGSVGYLMREPLVQTEGLVMDRAYVNRLKSVASLRRMLNDYNVRYYIGSSESPIGTCFEGVEPSQAGPHSPKLRDAFCQEPVLKIEHEGHYTVVLDLQPGRARHS